MSKKSYSWFLGPFRMLWRSHPRRELVYLFERKIWKHVIFESIHSIRFGCRFSNQWNLQLIAEVSKKFLHRQFVLGTSILRFSVKEISSDCSLTLLFCVSVSKKFYSWFLGPFRIICCVGANGKATSISHSECCIPEIFHSAIPDVFVLWYQIRPCVQLYQI